MLCVFSQDQGKEYVGFATLPNQVHRKSVKKGFDFTLMVAGKRTSADMRSSSSFVFFVETLKSFNPRYFPS